MANGVEEHGARLNTVESEVEKLRRFRHDVYTEQYNLLLLRLITIENKMEHIASSKSTAWEIIRPVLTTMLTGFAMWIAVVLLKLYH